MNVKLSLLQVGQGRHRLLSSMENSLRLRSWGNKNAPDRTDLSVKGEYQRSAVPP